MQITNKKRNKILIMVIIIFIIAICWQLFLTLGFDFFWEDFDVFHPYWERPAEFKVFKEKYLPESINPSQLTLTLGIGKEFAKQFFAPQRLFQVGFESHSQIDRPYQFLTWDLAKVIFGNKVILHQIFKAAIFAINTCLVFLIIQRISLLFALWGVFLYMTSSEIWLSIVYKANHTPIAQGAVILSVLLFLKLLEKFPVRFRDTLFFYTLIIIVSNVAVLITHDGRYLAIILFLTILLFRRKELSLHILPLLALFIMEFPILGYIKKIFHPDFLPINFATHIGSNPSIFESLKIAVSNYKFARNAAGSFILVILYITIMVHLIYTISRFILRKNFTDSKNEEQPIRNYKEYLFLFLLWFLATLTMSAMARKLRYDGSFNLQLSDLSFFIAPFIIFSCYYVALISARVRKLYRITFLSICLCLLSVQILHNIDRLNKFRGGWGNYFIANQNVRKYIDENSNNALALAFTVMHHKPFLFLNSNNKIINTQEPCKISPFCDLQFIEDKFDEGFDDVFVVSNIQKLDFRGSSKNVNLKQVLQIDGDSGALYDRLKRFICHPSKPMIYLYHFKYKDSN